MYEWAATDLLKANFAVVYLLNICGEALRFILCLSFSLISSGHLSDGLLEKLGQFQLRSQTLLLLLLLCEEEQGDTGEF